MNPLLLGAVALVSAACGPAAQQDTTLVTSSDPELRRAAAAILPDLAVRSGLELLEPVRVEKRSRAQLETYLRFKLDEEFPPDEARRMTRAYTLLGLVPEGLDLRALMLSVYTEQVAGFYDPDSTALFVMDDQPVETQVPLLLHELVHAVQDQHADLDALTDRSLGNDRQMAAQAAIEGHATLVMFEQMLEDAQGAPVDLSEIPDFTARFRPMLETARSQYPALATAPRVIQESILFPYLEGAGFVQAVWSVEGDARPAPFGRYLPQSTEQVLRPERFVGVRDAPTPVALEIGSGTVTYTNSLGAHETRIFLEELVGPSAGALAEGWDGDSYALVEEGGADGLVWAVVWDDTGARDRFVEGLASALQGLPLPSTIESIDPDGRPGALLRVGGLGGEVTVTLGTEGVG